MAEDADQKTEEPSQRKLDDAREKGQVVLSREVVNWFMMLAIAVTMLLLAPMVASGLRRALQRFIEKAGALRLDSSLVPTLLDSLGTVALVIAAPLALMMAAAVAGTAMQTGLIFAVEKLTPDFNHVSPVQGAKRMFSQRALVEFGKGLLKILIVGGVVAWLLLPELDRLPLLPSLALGEMLKEIYALVLRLVIGVVAVTTVLAVLDYLYQRFDFRKSMRMSKQEVREEYKRTEGDPQIKARIRQIRTERARRRMMAAVPDASVVITNPTHFAVALQYEMSRNNAPRVVAKGADLIAARIREIAKANEVPIVENPPLARTLYAAVEIDQEIPPEHYKAVAEVISYVFRLKGKLKNPAGAAT
jgi:flagellar biosynthetic protein FlhB